MFLMENLSCLEKVTGVTRFDGKQVRYQRYLGNHMKVAKIGLLTEDEILHHLVIGLCRPVPDVPALLLYVEDVSLVEHVHQRLVRTYGHLGTGIVLGWKVAQSMARWAAVRMSRVQIFARPSQWNLSKGVRSRSPI